MAEDSPSKSQLDKLGDRLRAGLEDEADLRSLGPLPFQHRWAEVSEKMADVIDPAIKYGGGQAEAQALLESFGEVVLRWEALEHGHRELLASAEGLRSLASTMEDSKLRRELEAKASEASAIVARDTADAKSKTQANFVAMMRALEDIRKRKDL